MFHLSIHALDPKGFKRGLKIDKVVEARVVDGEQCFAVKWIGCDDIDVIPAKVAKMRIPQEVIKYYEERCAWKAPNHPTARQQDLNATKKLSCD